MPRSSLDVALGYLSNSYRLKTFWLDIVPPKTTHQSGNTILKTKQGRYFVGKSSKGKKLAQELTLAVKPFAPSSPYECPLCLKLYWIYPFRKTEKKAIRSKDLYPCTTRPDLDNITKGFVDALGKAPFFKDDSQIFNMTLTKLYGKRHGVWVEIKALTEI